MSEKSNSGGCGCLGTLLLIFVVLKFVGLVDWSWWWVLSPIWIWLSLFALLVFLKLIEERS